MSKARILNRNGHAEKRDMPAIQIRSTDSRKRFSYICKMLPRMLFFALSTSVSAHSRASLHIIQSGQRPPLPLPEDCPVFFSAVQSNASE